MIVLLPFKRRDRHLTNTFAVTIPPQKAIAPDFKMKKSGAFHLKKPICSTFLYRKGVMP
jgi:hypothetical protein